MCVKAQYALLFVGVDVVSRLGLGQLLHAPPLLLQRLHVDPVLLHHIVDRMVVEDVWRRSALHLGSKSKMYSVIQSSWELLPIRRNKAPWLDWLAGSKLP